VLKKFWGLLTIVLFVVSCGSSGKAISQKNADLDNAIATAAADIIAKLPPNTKIALFNISTNESALTEYVIEELSVILVNKAELIILDRYNLDIIRAEQDFQLSGDVHDDDIISIGRKSGASSVISCSITGEDDLRRLRIRTLEVATSRVQSLTSHAIKKIPARANAQNTQQSMYDDLQQFIKTAESQIKLTSDYITKSEICWNVVNEIDYFLYDSNDQKINDSVSKTRSVWYDRATKLDETWKSLTDELIAALEEKAQEVSKSQNSGYNIEKISLVDFNITRPDSVSALMSVTFQVKMRGNIIGFNTREFKLTVKGTINMRTDKIEVYEGHTVERI